MLGAGGDVLVVDAASLASSTSSSTRAGIICADDGATEGIGGSGVELLLVGAVVSSSAKAAPVEDSTAVASSCSLIALDSSNDF